MKRFQAILHFMPDSKPTCHLCGKVVIRWSLIAQHEWTIFESSWQAEFWSASLPSTSQNPARGLFATSCGDPSATLSSGELTWKKPIWACITAKPCTASAQRASLYTWCKFGAIGRVWFAISSCDNRMPDGWKQSSYALSCNSRRPMRNFWQRAWWSAWNIKWRNFIEKEHYKHSNP